MVDKEESQLQKKDSVENEAELIGRIIQSEQKLSEYFTTIITKSVTEQIERRNLARLRLIGVVSVVLVSVIIPAVTLWIKGTINSQTQVAIEEHFSEAIEGLDTRFSEQTKQLEVDFEAFLANERTYLTFANYALYLADRAQVPERELKEVLDVLDKIANQPSLTNRPDFPFLVDLIVRTAIGHGYTDTLNALEERFQGVLTASSRTMPRLARFNGERVVGDRFTSERKFQTALDKFQRYLDLSQGSPEFVQLLPLQLMVERSLGNERADDRVEAIQLYVFDLPPAQQADFIAATVRYSNPDFRDVSATGRNRRIGVAAGRMVVDEAQFYADLLKDNGVQAAITQLAELEANRENMGIATALYAFRQVFVKGLASGEDPKVREAVERLVKAEIEPWLNEPVIFKALKAQNRETAAYSSDKIKNLERQWQDEFASGQYELIAEVLDRRYHVICGA